MAGLWLKGEWHRRAVPSAPDWNKSVKHNLAESGNWDSKVCLSIQHALAYPDYTLCIHLFVFFYSPLYITSYAISYVNTYSLQLPFSWLCHSHVFIHYVTAPEFFFKPFYSPWAFFFFLTRIRSWKIISKIVTFFRTVWYGLQCLSESCANFTCPTV